MITSCPPRPRAWWSRSTTPRATSSGIIEKTALAAGKQSLTWDGRDRNGNTVADGAYTFEVQAVDQKGAKLDVTTFSKGTVTGVTFEDGVTYLITGRNKTAIGDVTQVTQAAAPAAKL